MLPDQLAYGCFNVSQTTWSYLAYQQHIVHFWYVITCFQVDFWLGRLKIKGAC